MNRLLALFITVFFATMWTLLLRTELRPQKTALRKVPVEHVLKLFFQHQQPSDLFIHGSGERLGHVRFHPQVNSADDSRVIEFSGNAQLRIPGAPKQRIMWDGAAEYFQDMALRTVQLKTGVRESTTQPAPETTVNIFLNAMNRLVNYSISVDGRPVDQASFTLDENGVQGLMRRAGIDPELLRMVNSKAQSSTPPKISAHQSSLRLKSEEVETLLVTVEMNAQTMLEFHVSQLGQILHAKTLTGWTLEMD
jgi:hypothetical protein